jgi:YVTN family beta-propeller protein
MRIACRRSDLLGCLCLLFALGGLNACSPGAPSTPSGIDPAASTPTTVPSVSPTASKPSPAKPAPQPVTPASTRNVYGAIASGTYAPAVNGIPTRVYVPDNDSNDVRVIDPKTFKVVRTFAVGNEPQHVSPSWDLRHLYVGNVYSNTLTEIDPRSGRVVRTIDVPDPYNLYFTPDGRHAIDVAEGHDTLYFYDPHTWRLQGSLRIPYRGPDHLDFSANGRYFLISTEYGGVVVKVQVQPRRIVGAVDVGGSTVDVKVAPGGKVFYVANQIRGGVSVIDPTTMKEVRFIATGAGAHGFAMARDARHLYVTNRLAGTISVIDTRTEHLVSTWNVGGSPDMLQVSADGTQLWTSNRFDASVSVIDTRTGKVLHVIPVGGHPHGLTLFPQPGRYSIGHNGVYR